MEDALPVKADKRRVLVTGASSGIGRAIAVSLGELGMRVALTARREDKLEEAAQAVREAGGEAMTVVADFQQEAQVLVAVGAAASKWGGLDILINSAGIGRQAKLMDGDSADWRDMLEVNVLGLAVASREALFHFDAEKGGHIVNICSMSGHRVPGRGGFYAATKFAVRALSEGLRQELRLDGNMTRVSQLSPGFVETELLDEYFQSAGKDRYSAANYPILAPRDIADSVVHVLTAPAHVDITDILVRPTEQPT